MSVCKPSLMLIAKRHKKQYSLDNVSDEPSTGHPNQSTISPEQCKTTYRRSVGNIDEKQGTQALGDAQYDAAERAGGHERSGSSQYHDYLRGIGAVGFTDYIQEKRPQER